MRSVICFAVLLALGVLSGCTPTGQINVSYDPISGQPTIGGGIAFKNLTPAQREVVRQQLLDVVNESRARELSAPGSRGVGGCRTCQ